MNPPDGGPGVIILQQLAAMLLSGGPIERRKDFLF
jgi:hypothetical protein